MFAAWEVGVWKVLRTRMQFDMILGASAGAWNGWAIAGGVSPEELQEEWMHARMADVMRPSLHRHGFLHPQSLYNQAQRLYQRFQPKMPFGLTMVELPRMRPRLVRGDEVKWQHLAATASIPLAFPPMKIDGRSYVDGGFPGSALPLWAAEEMGATRAFGVLCLTTWPFRMLRHVVPSHPPGKGLQVIRIEPSEPLGSMSDAIFWKSPNVKRWIALGERDANRTLLSIATH
jgi:predicted acylesterase/phospholipase RssA